MSNAPRHAVILVSGGLDSATVLAIARHEGYCCHALTFDYGQRHRAELQAAELVAHTLGAEERMVVNIDLRAFGGSALTADIEVPHDRQPENSETIPITYVPARNIIFLSFALGYAEVHNIRNIFIGVNAVDYSGYPDCRPDFIKSFEKTANLGTKMGVEASEAKGIRIHTPLIDLSKADIIRQGIELGVDYGLTLSCYDPVVAAAGVETPYGVQACGSCDACILRAAGFAEVESEESTERQ